MILALNTVSLKSLWVVPVDFEVFELRSAQLSEYGMIYSTVFIANTCPECKSYIVDPSDAVGPRSTF